MNTLDILKYGHQTVLEAVKKLPDEAWTVPGVCGKWSVKDIIAHLASFEQVLSEVLTQQREPEQPAPTLELFRSSPGFNDDQVALHKDKPATEVQADYEATHAQVMARATELAPEAFHKNGALPWYGANYDLDDFIVYTFYGHKREHCAQIKLFRKRQDHAISARH